MSCDADFCNCGRCKAGGSGVYLTKAVQKIENKPAEKVLEKAPSKYDILKLKMKENYIF